MAVPEHVIQDELKQPSFWRSLSIMDWIFAVLIMAGTIYAHQHYSYLMDAYEVGILYGTGLSLIALGWWWKQTRIFMAVVAFLSLAAVMLYEPAIASLKAEGITGNAAIAALSSLSDPAHSKFLFKYFLSSTSAIMWMSALFVMATFTYFFYLFTHNAYAGRVASAMTWSASAMGTVGLLVRWRESYLVNVEYGHIPVSNLYEVFILFAVMTALIYLHYEGRYKTKGMGAFVLLIISSSVAFLLWYHFDKGAHEIAPLVPALQSYWMKIHVPANFVGYGTFALAAMLGILYLVRENAAKGGARSMVWLVGMHVLAVGIIGYSLVQYFAFDALTTAKTTIYTISGIFLLVIYYLSVQKQRVLNYFPKPEVIDDVMHKAIALGFAFFTIATVLGAMWAAEAWGGYWSWDPKETWALIVWLNYAAWLHLRLTKGWRGAPLAWWAIIGLFITTFAFLGVNMFLSGLHSYGEL